MKGKADVSEQLVLPLEAHGNHYLFSDYYLDHLLPRRIDWQEATSEARAARNGHSTISRGQPMRKRVYNLEFRSWCPEMTIFGYRFVRVEGYQRRLADLQHRLAFSAEFNISPNTGTHAATAYVHLPATEERSVLEWGAQDDATALSDILLLLSIFAMRDVFAVDESFDEKVDGIFTADPRLHKGGAILGCSVPYKPQTPGQPYTCDIGFEETMNSVCALVRSPDWRGRYGGGYLLFLARQALRSDTLESRFVQCWTIWEHLFTLHNRAWLSEREIQRLGAIEKIAFLLVQYGLAAQVERHDKLRGLSAVRNRLVHFGRFPEGDSAQRDARLFIDLTEVILAKILSLSPSNVFSTQDRWDRFMETGEIPRSASACT